MCYGSEVFILPYLATLVMCSNFVRAFLELVHSKHSSKQDLSQLALAISIGLTASGYPVLLVPQTGPTFENFAPTKFG